MAELSHQAVVTSLAATLGKIHASQAAVTQAAAAGYATPPGQPPAPADGVPAPTPKKAP